MGLYCSFDDISDVIIDGAAINHVVQVARPASLTGADTNGVYNKPLKIYCSVLLLA